MAKLSVRAGSSVSVSGQCSTQANQSCWEVTQPSAVLSQTTGKQQVLKIKPQLIALVHSIREIWWNILHLLWRLFNFVKIKMNDSVMVYQHKLPVSITHYCWAAVGPSKIAVLFWLQLIHSWKCNMKPECKPASPTFLRYLQYRCLQASQIYQPSLQLIKI